MKTFKKIIALVLVSCLLMCSAPSAFAAQTSADSDLVLTAEEGDIVDNPIFQGAVVEIIASFLASFREIIERYVQIIIALLSQIELPDFDAPDAPDAPDAGDGDDVIEGEGGEGEGEGDDNTNEGEGSGEELQAA